ncbi:DNA cytosine methyltransferase [Marilutibacter spongiae]|uniref:DNA (cytosine-5-)-methyltransferase n=1 Tax=Marilutibacter spongiae TaxID=2025720 RepID=A0A7W3TL49_9GAMM|nr:DNA cytosine methyltransferase [Lysobacter spongiae]MBB1060378.1 DNA cytosine methyltransferase [Lysobacter spongiae]
MADGSRSFNFPAPQLSALRPGEIVVDLFAGGGGASEALKQALGVDPALAYNHDAWAIGMHAANHPLTDHHREDIWHADPRRDVAGRPVGWFHASPDCTHFSQAKGGQPRNRKIRALTWVVLKWVGQLLRADALYGTNTAPRIISLENVWQILTWGPLVAKRDKATGRVLKMDGTVAVPGERVPVECQQLVPDKGHAGRTWRQFIAALEALGYVVEWRKLVASDYGAGTSRERLFLVARRDGEAIVWPEPTHGTGPGLQKPATAADSIDFGDLGRSIFDRPRPLADATMRRIAKGLVRHVLQADEPFFLTEFANASNGRTWSAMEPLRTQCAGVKGGHFALVAPALVKFKGDSTGHPVTDPVPTITAGGDCKRPAGAAHSLAVMSAFLTAMAQNVVGNDLREPVPTILAGATRFGVVSADLAQLDPEQEAGALRVAAFLVNYYGNGQALDVRDPLDTVTTRDRMALVTVMVHGTPYVIVDIKLRMLKPAELFRAQGFPRDYVIDRTADGRPISNTHAVRMVGNSVSPPPLAAIARANLDPAEMPERLAA